MDKLKVRFIGYGLDKLWIKFGHDLDKVGQVLDRVGAGFG